MENTTSAPNSPHMKKNKEIFGNSHFIGVFKRLSAHTGAICFFAVAIILATAGHLYASPTVGTGVLLFNYSNVTANVAETSTPSPYCVNNQGQIPQPMTVAAGSVDNPNEANQDVEFTAQSTGASCRLLYRNELTDDRQYPFNLYFSSGQPALEYTFGTSPPINDPSQCAAGYTVGNLVGIYQGMACVWDKVDNFYWFYYLNNTVLTVFPPAANYYYTMTSLAGPSGTSVPTGVPETIAGSGTACSAPNWNSCVLIQVYNTGEGPYPSGAASPQAAAGAASTAGNLAEPQATSFMLPAVAYPVVRNVDFTFDAENVHVTLYVKAGSVSRPLIQTYGRQHLANSLDVLLRVNGDDQLRADVSKSVTVNVTQGAAPVRLPLTFSQEDILAIRRALAQGRALDVRIQVKQHVATPHETYELPRVKRIRYQNPS